MSILYLTGATNLADEAALIANGIGLMVQPGNGYHRWVDRYPYFAADNGCFGGRWEEHTHLRWLEALPRDRCLFAVSPDVYGDAAASLERGLAYAPLIREMGFPVAVVAQDGAELMRWPWEQIDALFLGGERTADPRHEWKTSDAAANLARAARAAGKWVHMGRCNSRRRLVRAMAMGCNSADGTFIKHRRRARRLDNTGAARRGAGEIGGWVAQQVLPGIDTFEAPSLPIHRQAHR